MSVSMASSAGVAGVAAALLAAVFAASPTADSRFDPVDTDPQPGVSEKDGRYWTEVVASFALEPGQAFALTNRNGGIEVAGHSGAALELEATKQVRPDGNGLGRIFGGDRGARAAKFLAHSWIMARHDDAGLAIETELPDESGLNPAVHYVLRVPHGLAVALDSRNGAVTVQRLDATSLAIETRNGAITARDVESPTITLDTRNGRVTGDALAGALDIDSRNGGTNLRDIDGSVSVRGRNGIVDIEQRSGATSVRVRNGNIQLKRLGTLTQDNAITCDSRNGRIVVELPAQAGFTLDATSDDGPIRVNAPGYAPEIAEKARAVGATDAAGAPIRIATGNGAIFVGAR
jgi:hypothetical protein